MVPVTATVLPAVNSPGVSWSTMPSVNASPALGPPTSAGSMPIFTCTSLNVAQIRREPDDRAVGPGRGDRLDRHVLALTAALDRQREGVAGLVRRKLTAQWSETVDGVPVDRDDRVAVAKHLGSGRVGA